MSQQVRSRSAVRAAVIIAGIQVVGALLFTLARQEGLIDNDTATRGAMVLIGLGVAAWGNRMPKALDGPPAASLASAAIRQGVQRVGGWALTLAGLVYAGLWAFAPRDLALTGCIVAVGAAMVVVFTTIIRSGVALHRSSDP